MSAVFKIFLSMSFSGSLLILVLLLGKPFLKDKVSRQWQYYIWLAVILRLLLPFGPEASLMGRVFRAVEQARAQATLSSPQENTQSDIFEPVDAIGPGSGSRGSLAAARPIQDVRVSLSDHIWIVWLMGAIGLLVRKVTIYQGFIRYIRAGSTPVSDIGMLDQLSMASEQAGVKRPIELCVDPMIASPLLIGSFHPCIVLPSADISEKDLRYIILHELTHYKRHDMSYKWLVQAVVCLHWFNPLVHLMSREITRACEFSCDEAVLSRTGGSSAQEYGKTLLDAMMAVGRYKEDIGAVTLSKDKQLLKERLGAIMKFKERSRAVKALTVILTLCMVSGASFIGLYGMDEAQAASVPGTPDLPAEREGQRQDTIWEDRQWKGMFWEDGQWQSMFWENGQWKGMFWEDGQWKDAWQGDDASYTPAKAGDPVDPGTSAAPGRQPARTDGTSSDIEEYYAANSIPMFQWAFCSLDEEEQGRWLYRLFQDDQIAFFGAAVNLLDEDCAPIRQLAEIVYEDGDIAYFSTLAMHMSEDTLEDWLDRALEDGNWVFQSVLANALDVEQEDVLDEKKWEREQIAEYGALGITIDGKDYRYQGQLVNIFLDIRPDKSFCTLDMNPAGTINIKIVRNEDNEITGVAYMTEAEVAELFGDMSDDDSQQESAKGRVWHPQLIPVDQEAMADNEIVWLGEYTLSEGDRIWYDVSAETGNGLQVGFARPEDTDLNVVYYFVSSLREKGEALACTASLTVRQLAEPGTYRLFLRATDGALGNVKGSIAIGYIADASWIP